MAFSPEVLDHYPLDPGVYLMKGAKGNVLYVGKAICLRKRIKQYFSPGRDTRPTLPLLMRELASIDTIVVNDEKEALILENTLIKTHKPKFNILLKDDKNYIGLALNPQEKWPRFRWARKKEKQASGVLYFGPYTSAKAARDTFELMTRLFPLRQCSDEELKRRTRPCLLYGMKRCLAPCVGLCSEEEYATYVEGSIDFLRGKSKAVTKRLKEEMNKASEALEFEKAASLLRTLRQIEQITGSSSSLAYRLDEKNRDVLGLYRKADCVLLIRLIFREGTLMGKEPFFFEQTLEEEEEILSSFLLQEYGDRTELPDEILLPFPLAQKNAIRLILQEKRSSPPCLITTPSRGYKKDLIDLAHKNAVSTFEQYEEQKGTLDKLLSDLQQTLHLQNYPKTIECIDTSHFMGAHFVASLVVFKEGKEDPKKGRVYHIKDIRKGDDYAALHQTLTRRLLRAKEENNFPDLFIIDGGKGQLEVALDVFKELDLIFIDVISLVKEEGRHDKGLTRERVCLPREKEPLSLPLHSPLLFFLQNIRDKAHTKAINFHRKTRSKGTLKTSLSSLKGLGEKTKQRLLEEFESPQGIYEALEKAPQAFSFLSMKQRQALYEHLKTQLSPKKDQV